MFEFVFRYDSKTGMLISSFGAFLKSYSIFAKKKSRFILKKNRSNRSTHCNKKPVTYSKTLIHLSKVSYVNEHIVPSEWKVLESLFTSKIVKSHVVLWYGKIH